MNSNEKPFDHLEAGQTSLANPGFSAHNVLSCAFDLNRQDSDVLNNGFHQLFEQQRPALLEIKTDPLIVKSLNLLTIPNELHT